MKVRKKYNTLASLKKKLRKQKFSYKTFSNTKSLKSFIVKKVYFDITKVIHHS